jgi:hypothetical protein
VIGWANVALVEGRLETMPGYARRRPQSRAFRRSLDAELAQMERFLSIETSEAIDYRNANEFAT